MRLAGMELSSAAAAELVVLLNRARYTNLAQRLGRAIDANLRELPMTSRDQRPILDVLVGETEGPLADLRDKLERQGNRATRTHLD